MAVFLSIWGPSEYTSSFWLGIAGWALGFIGNGTSTGGWANASLS